MGARPSSTAGAARRKSIPEGAGMLRRAKAVVQVSAVAGGMLWATASWAGACPAGADPTYCKLAEATGGKVVMCPKGPADVMAKCMADAMADALPRTKEEDTVAARYAEAAARPGPDAVLDCRKTLNGYRVNAPRDRRVQKVLKDHLRWGGTAHNPLPHPHANYEDIVAARNALTPGDIPLLTHLILTGKLGSGAKPLAFGTLQQFGPDALPCIDAALSMGSAGAQFSTLRTSIELSGPPRH